MKRVLSREFLGHHAEHEAKHRLKEKVSFAVLEHGLLLGEGFVSRVADDLRLRKLAAAPPPPSPMRDAVAGLFRRARGGNARPKAAVRNVSMVDGVLEALFPSSAPARREALDALVSALPSGAFALIRCLRVLIPACGMYLVLHMARSDYRRAKREWREKKLRTTTALFYVAFIADSLDAVVHGTIVLAHVTHHIISHHTLHALESFGIILAALAFAAMVLGEIISNNRIGRGVLNALDHMVHAADNALDHVVHHHKHPPKPKAD